MISVIIPLYNKESAIKKTVESVLNQTYRDFELLIINDGSTDNSLEVLSKFKDQRIRIISKPNGGVSSARNYGIKNAKGNYIFFLDADDIIIPTCLELFFSLSKKYQRISVFVANFKTVIGDKAIPYCKGKKEILYNYPLKALWKEKIFPRTGAMLIRRNCFEKIGTFNCNISVYEDLELIIRLLKKYEVIYSPSIVLLYQKQYSNLSSTLQPFNKELAYFIDLNGTGFYQRLILAENIYKAFLARHAHKDRLSKSLLIKKYKKQLPFIICTYFMKKVIRGYNLILSR